MGFGGGLGNVVSGGLAGVNAVQSKKTALAKAIDEYLVSDIPELDVVAKGKPAPAK
jgi:hypothetical protein